MGRDDRRRVWVAELIITKPQIAKIGSKHGLSPQDISDRLVCRAGLAALYDPLRDRWHLDVEGVRVILVEHETEADVYRSVTAFRISA